jgi:hypothetical protein
MANRKFLWGILAMVLVFGVLIISCNTDGDNDLSTNNNPKKITITGLTGQSGQIIISLANHIDGASYVATGAGTISGDSVTLSLKKYGFNIDWTDTGSYYSYVTIGSKNPLSAYYYTNGKTFAELGITGYLSMSDMDKLEKISITETTTVVAFEKFRYQGDI